MNPDNAPVTPVETPPVKKGPSLLDRMNASFEELGPEFNINDDPAGPTPVVPKKAPEGKTEPEVSEEGDLPSFEEFASLEDKPVEPKKKAEPEKKKGEETDIEEIPEFVQKQGEKAKETWGVLKQSEKTLKAEVAELKEKLAKVAAPETETEITQLRERVKEHEARVAEQERIIAAVRVEESKEYHDTIIVPFAAIETEIKELADSPEAAEVLYNAMVIPDRKKRGLALTEATEDMPEYNRHRIYEMVAEYDKLAAHEVLLKTKAKEAKAEIDRNALAKQHQESEADQKARGAAVTKVWGTVEQKLPFMFDGEGNLRPEFAEVRETGKESILSASLGTQVFAGFAARLVPLMNTELAKKTKEIADLTAQIERLTGAGPGPRKTPVSQRKGESTGGKRETAVDRINKAFEEGKVTV